MQNDFRLRAIWSGSVLGPIAFAVFITSKQGAPSMYHGLTQWWAPLLIGATICFAVAALVSLWLRQFAFARVAGPVLLFPSLFFLFRIFKGKESY